MSLLLPSTRENGLYAAGIDEAGRGSLIAPVTAAIVILPNDFLDQCKEKKIIIRDSKKMTKLQREKSKKFIESHAIDFNVQFIDEKKIDEIGILKSTMLCMNKCVDNLKQEPLKLLIDGNYYENHRKDLIYETFIKGDEFYPEISCASILAKTYRDEYIQSLVQEDSSLQEKYNLANNMGYGTKKHIDGIREYGLSDLHRKSFCKNFV